MSKKYTHFIRGALAMLSLLSPAPTALHATDTENEKTNWKNKLSKKEWEMDSFKECVTYLKNQGIWQLADLTKGKYNQKYPYFNHKVASEIRSYLNENKLKALNQNAINYAKKNI